MNNFDLKGLIGTRYFSLPTKQDALLFDTICLGGEGGKQKAATAELDFLQENGIVKIVPKFISDHSFEFPDKKIEKLNKAMFSNFMGVVEDKKVPEKEKAWALVPIVSEYCDRSLAVMIRDHYGVDATPILESPPMLKISKAAHASVLKVLLRSLPLPSDDVPWESIIDFRNDVESRGKLIELRRWARRIAKEEMSIMELQDELEFLIVEYKKRLKLHKMKMKLGLLQTFIASPVGVLENVIKLNFRQAINDILFVQKEKIDLLDGELNLPGREVAYIIHAQERFRQTE